MDLGYRTRKFAISVAGGGERERCLRRCDKGRRNREEAGCDREYRRCLALAARRHGRGRAPDCDGCGVGDGGGWVEDVECLRGSMNS